MKPLFLLAVAFAVGGCSSLQQVEVQNDGPGPATVTFRYEDDGRKVDREVEVKERGAELAALWFYEAPPRLEVEAKWSNAVRRQTFPLNSLPEGLRRATSGGTIHGLSVSPNGMRWGSPTLWVRIQNPALIPGVLFCLAFGFSRWIRYRRRNASTPPSSQQV